MQKTRMAARRNLRQQAVGSKAPPIPKATVGNKVSPRSRAIMSRQAGKGAMPATPTVQPRRTPVGTAQMAQRGGETLLKQKTRRFQTGGSVTTGMMPPNNAQQQQQQIGGSMTPGMMNVGGMPKKKKAPAKKVEKVMSEFKQGKLKSSSGSKVKNPKQAIAIALSEAGKSKPKKKKA